MTNTPTNELSREERIARARRATERARPVLKVGDRLSVNLCGGRKGVVTMIGWEGDWICSATRNDIHASHIYRVNGAPMSFNDEDAGAPHD